MAGEAHLGDLPGGRGGGGGGPSAGPGQPGAQPVLALVQRVRVAVHHGHSPTSPSQAFSVKDTGTSASASMCVFAEAG